MNKESIQSAEYEFPLHYIPYIKNDAVYLHRTLNWGLMYLTYLDYITNFIEDYHENWPKPRRILDYGCGDGRLLYELDKKEHDIFPYKLYGYDINKRAMNFTILMLAHGVEYTHALCYDIIILMQVLEHIQEKKIPSLLQELNTLYNRKTKEGFLIAAVPTTNLPIIDKHYRHYTLDLLRQQLSPYFEIYGYQYLFSYTPLTYLFTRLLSNPLFDLNYAPLCRLIWQLHKKYTYYSNEKHGAHLVVFAKPII